MTTTTIFLAGFHHETNTFAPSPADWAAFTVGSGSPPYARGDAMLRQMAHTSMPIGGFVAEAIEHGWALKPSVWAGAVPSNRVTAEAFERLCNEIVEDLKQGGFDAVYLDLHGAAVAEGADDAEGELLARIRAVVGTEMPVIASLDLHANVTERMLQLATAMTAYRTYPHVDMRETGQRAARMLARRLVPASAKRAVYAERVPFLLPLNAQCTLMHPAMSIIEMIEKAEGQNDVELNFAMGFSAADFAECGPVLFGYGLDPALLAPVVHELWTAVAERHRADWTLDLQAPAEAVEHAIGLALVADKPVVIADTQDNPGAGGDANTTGMLHALIEADAGKRLEGRVAIGLIFDPTAAQAACDAGVDATVSLQIGRAVPTWTGALTDPPVSAEARVLAISDGEVELHGPMTAGSTAHLGASACVEIAGIKVLLASAKAQMLDLDLYRYLGVEPEKMLLLVNKSSVHFRAAFAPIASTILVAKAPGPMAADPADLPWKHLAAGTSPRP